MSELEDLAIFAEVRRVQAWAKQFPPGTKIRINTSKAPWVWERVPEDDLVERSGSLREGE